MLLAVFQCVPVRRAARVEMKSVACSAGWLDNAETWGGGGLVYRQTKDGMANHMLI